MRIRIRVESAEVATLKPDGRPWDGPGGPRIEGRELERFFGLDLTRQLERLVATGAPPDPPEVFVRVYDGSRLVVETIDQSSFDPRWTRDADGEADLVPGAPLRIEVWDRDLVFHDLIGRTVAPLPSAPSGGDVAGVEGGARWELGPFGQVRRLVLRVG